MPQLLKQFEYYYSRLLYYPLLQSRNDPYL